MCAWSECGGIGRRCRPLPVARRLAPAAASVESTTRRAAPVRSARVESARKKFLLQHETCSPRLRYRLSLRPLIRTLFSIRLSEKFVFLFYLINLWYLRYIQYKKDLYLSRINKKFNFYITSIAPKDSTP